MKRALEAVKAFFRNLGGVGGKIFSSDELVIRIKKSSLSSFVLGFIFAAPIFIGASWLVGSGQAKTVDVPEGAAVVQEQPADNAVVGPVSFTISDRDYVLGSKDAKVTLVLFSDLQCSYCSRHHETVKALAAKYKNNIAIVWRHYPLSFHEYSNIAANAAECAGEQGKFWEFIDAAFKDQANFSDTIWAKLAGDLKLNVTKFNKCLSDKKYDSKISGEMAEGLEKGVQGTPATFINGMLVSGAVAQSEFETEIDKLLK